ncbi:AraC family transcriptional regulator [Neptunomonas phycophila]|uniref:AraC family transcriptional regulator n=1 Tax=Neptunomonas phycophila TaxID=1572645 RepID=A0AAW7XGT5_9GAMM|nr:AraC family transcriptional regulator [Neptunomonas phycophila]MDO6453245.1 AraC family transcriptional regulator [Neptunomonas phycophila]
MLNTLSIRSYTRQRAGHAHNYHQLVLPLYGVIYIELDTVSTRVGPGECVVIRSGDTHYFTAKEESRFVVADMSELPENLCDMSSSVFSVSEPLRCYLSFIESQLEHQVNTHLEASMYHLFYKLLAEQNTLRHIDTRVLSAQAYIADHLSLRLSIDHLASIACLSQTQFKKVFKEHVGFSVMQYITHVRMEKAKALLAHTDYPVQLVAEKVGYTDVSSFSRRFTAHFGLTPREITH